MLVVESTNLHIAWVMLIIAPNGVVQVVVFTNNTRCVVSVVGNSTT